MLPCIIHTVLFHKIQQILKLFPVFIIPKPVITESGFVFFLYMCLYHRNNLILSSFINRIKSNHRMLFVKFLIQIGIQISKLASITYVVPKDHNILIHRINAGICGNKRVSLIIIFSFKIVFQIIFPACMILHHRIIDWCPVNFDPSNQIRIHTI